MPMQEYNINTRDAVAGSLYGLQQTRADIQTVFAEDAIPFGVAVKIGAGERGVLPGADEIVLGIALRQIDREADKRPSDGSTSFKTGDTLPLCQEGRVNVMVNDAGTMVRGAAPFVESATGKFFIAAGAGRVAAKNVTWGISGTRAAGAIEHVVVMNAPAAVV